MAGVAEGAEGAEGGDSEWAEGAEELRGLRGLGDWTCPEGALDRICDLDRLLRIFGVNDDSGLELFWISGIRS